MDDALKNWLEKVKLDFERKGFEILLTNSKHIENSYMVDLDCDKFLARIIYWPKEPYEIEIIEPIYGEKIILEVKEFQKPENLEDYLNDLFENRLVKMGLINP